jgi:hypothetical protein
LFKRFSTVIIVFSTVFLKPSSKIGEPKSDKLPRSQILIPGAKFLNSFMTFKSVSPEQQKISHLLKFNSRPIFLDKLITFLKSDKTTSG